MVKAPQFENVEGFDTSRNGLFGIDLHITGLGLVFVNFDASIDGPAVRFQDWYEGVREQVETLGLAKNGGYAWSQSWVTEGNFNWKAVICKWRILFLFLPLRISFFCYFGIYGKGTSKHMLVFWYLSETSDSLGGDIHIPYQHLLFPRYFHLALLSVSHRTPLIPSSIVRVGLPLHSSRRVPPHMIPLSVPGPPSNNMHDLQVT